MTLHSLIAAELSSMVDGTHQTLSSVWHSPPQNVIQGLHYLQYLCQLLKYLVFTDQKKITKKALIHATVEAMNNVCKQNFNHSFIDSLIKCKSIPKEAKADQKKEIRQILKKCRDACNEELLKTTPTCITILKEKESMASYNSKRLAMYFDNEPSAKCTKKSHAPDFEKAK